MEGNFEWFVNHYDEIYSLYGECYVVILNKQIQQIFEDYQHAFEYAKNLNILDKCNIQLCNGDESGYLCYDYTILTY